MSRTKRTVLKWLVGIVLVLWVGVAFYGYQQTDGAKSSHTNGLTTVTVGYQKGDPFDIAKQRGKLVKKMKAKGYRLVLKQFQDGNALMQALKSGSIDYARAGDTPPVTAQSAGTDLAYVGVGSTKAKGSGILVKKNSGINSLKDLKGKKIAYTKGTSSQYLLLQLIEKAGLEVNDVDWVNMDQSAASVAFAKGKIDAWVTWDPYTAQAELTQNAKALSNGVGMSNNRDYILSMQTYAKSHKTVSKYLVDYLEDDMHWADTHHKQLTTMLSKSLKLKKSVVKKMVDRRRYSIRGMYASVVKEQQEMADNFYKNGITTKKINVKSAVTYLK
ncbi:aliphatic sulfonate ABC transporter substrate-binding protein [Levilactobacillus yiduensis]|uniref:aliphatic sulfonate ABC transporter substrate-binding protein n=1 Tax=Levilactobacillus yiduensis TaxID=2953880 RepID=UPI000EF31360|nr:aliphatic sulfonate ABC transporter substrate-binding protein [Levilactobacillus yiduensis]AYM01698.1 aliphatic sulfonate ABC transporter substrate-binding protein [Levilactobacillus brevis]